MHDQLTEWVITGMMPHGVTGQRVSTQTSQIAATITEAITRAEAQWPGLVVWEAKSPQRVELIRRGAPR